jgi:hypothetical protein
LFLCVAQLLGSEAVLTVRAASLAVPSEHASPRALTLTASDVQKATGKAFSGGGVVLTNATMAARVGVAKAVFDRHGRISGYEAEFEQQATAAFVVSQVFTYKTPAGAHWDFTHVSQNVQAHGYRRTTGPKVGSESLDLAYQKKQGTLTAVGYTAIFRQGSIDNAVTVAGFKSTVTLSQDVRNAQIVAAREPKR